MSRGRHVPFPSVPAIELAAAVTRKEAGLQQMNSEPAEAYKAFVHYCIMGPEARSCDVGKAMGKSRSMISTYRLRYHWGARIEEWWRGRQKRGADEVVKQEEKDTDSKQSDEKKEVIRREEWELHTDLMEAGKEALERWRASDRVSTLGEITKMFELASRLGRLAAGLPLNYTEISGNPEQPLRVEIEAALERVYGGDVVDVEGEVVDVEGVEALPEGDREVPGGGEG